MVGISDFSYVPPVTWLLFAIEAKVCVLNVLVMIVVYKNPSIIRVLIWAEYSKLDSSKLAEAFWQINVLETSPYDYRIDSHELI